MPKPQLNNKMFSGLYMKDVIRKRLTAYGWLIIAIIVFSQLLALTWWGFELFTHFSFHAAVAIFIMAWFVRLPIRVVWLCFSCSVIGWGLSPIRTIHPTSAHHTRHNVGVNVRDNPLKLLVYNVKINHTDPVAETRFIKDTQADILLLAEAGGQWQASLQTLSADYPFGCQHQEHSPFALAVLSKLPLNDCQVSFIDRRPFIRLHLRRGSGADNVVYLLHPPPPISRSLADIRIRYFQHTASRIAQETHPTLIVGDLNNTPFSPLYRRFTHAGGLVLQHRRFLPTWKPFFLPIDPILGKNLHSHRVTVKPLSWQGSDHRPLQVTWRSKTTVK